MYNSMSSKYKVKIIQFFGEKKLNYNVFAFYVLFLASGTCRPLRTVMVTLSCLCPNIENQLSNKTVLNNVCLETKYCLMKHTFQCIHTLFS